MASVGDTCLVFDHIPFNYILVHDTRIGKLFDKQFPLQQVGSWSCYNETDIRYMLQVVMDKRRITRTTDAVALYDMGASEYRNVFRKAISSDADIEVVLVEQIFRLNRMDQVFRREVCRCDECYNLPAANLD